MANFYVRTNGSDAADGSTGTPWLTLNKALTTVADGSAILMGTGTYVEPGNFRYNRNLTGISVSSESGVATDVVIQSTNSTNTCMLQLFGTGGFPAAGITFNNLTLKTIAGAQTMVISPVLEVANFTFNGCIFLAGSATTLYGMQSTSASLNLHNITFTNCTFDMTASTDATLGGTRAIYVAGRQGTPAPGIVSDITITGCTVYAASGFQIWEAPRVLISDCVIILTRDLGTYGFIVGVDQVSALPPAGYANGCVLKDIYVRVNNPTALGAHGGCIGKGADDCKASRIFIDYFGSGFGLVVKGENTYLVDSQLMTVWNKVGLEGTNAPPALYFKGAQGAYVDNCLLYAARGGHCLKAGTNNDSAYGGTPKPIVNDRIRNTRFVAQNGAHVATWQNGTPDLMGNTYSGDLTDPVFAAPLTTAQLNAGPVAVLGSSQVGGSVLGSILGRR